MYKFLPKTKISYELGKNMTSHELMMSLGFIQQPKSGLVHWLPLGLRVLQKTENIIRKHMRLEDCIELQLSQLSVDDNWKQSGRWYNKEFFKIIDSKKNEYCLIPTCEEDINVLMKTYLKSYKDLPMIVYQITNKYRDELRPRGGLLRSKEFLMKDAYSFARTPEESMQIFDKMNAAYTRIFEEIGMPYHVAWADNGNMGGDCSKEYHYESEEGEDTLFKCDHCNNVSNVEKTESMPLKKEEDCEVDVQYGLSKDHLNLLCFYYPRGRQLNWNRCQEIVENDIDEGFIGKDEKVIIDTYLHKLGDDVIDQGVLRIIDARLTSTCKYPDFPINRYLKNNFITLDEESSIVEAADGEICSECGVGKLKSIRSIEVGHTFNIGRKYSETFGFQYINSEDKKCFVEMGCYGIGISRIVGSIGKINLDSKGFRWPSVIAPYQVSIVGKDEGRVDPVVDLLKENYEDEMLNLFKVDQLKKNGKMGIREQMMISEAIGVPICLVVGGRRSGANEVEMMVRGNKQVAAYNKVVSLDQLQGELKDVLEKV
ncbi:hypothetical protein TBLA_0C05080 [Henningerozyma blattae CBS 6284]|uniref:Aminoacyl-tRNA synthetase class II (G/ P/ S/T) domain-containing protein n=1 Tax=Henningerozyma blattae (strain ATCC 34711 / CBS 6284 / DSM 70876 / NBRC 10599 / NRRL Y-10934 / UCD 77-7) TaxID=1071380 RepID=I2H1Q2_HENB6|nr:hypothetical protein TBLA_0C05080 [Tetrapisispora blattae CBS 6284]CCH60304.1 hypothetical protein TBLA_0C05080 [Tetrapisispora blattae CBS 6284]